MNTKSIEQIRAEIHAACGAPLDEEMEMMGDEEAPATLRSPPSDPNQDRPVNIQIL